MQPTLNKDNLRTRAFKACACSLIILSIVYVFLYSRAAAYHFPIETWFHYLPLLEKHYKGTLAFKDLFLSYGEHGMFGENVLFLLNGIFFNLSSDFEAVISNSVSIFILGFLFYDLIKREKRFGTGLFIVLLILLAFLVIPVDSHATGMNIQVRLGVLWFVLTSVLIDRAFMEDRIPMLRLTGIILSMLVSINIFGTLYSMAGVPCIALYMFIGAIRYKELRRERITILVCYVLFALLYFIQYGVIKFSSSGGSSINSGWALGNLLACLEDPLNLLKEFIAWCVAGFLNVSAIDERMISETGVIAAGAAALVFYIGAVVIYLKKRYYRQFYLPAFLMSYSVFLWIELLAGRPFGWTWYLSSWYSVHARLLPIGALLIYAYAVTDRKKSTSAWRVVLRAVAAVFCVLICILNGIGTKNLIDRGPYAREWEKSKFKYLFVADESEMPVDEKGMTPLLNTLTDTMKGIRIMKEHNLNVFDGVNTYREVNEVGSTMENCRKIRGISGDGWMTDKAEIRIRTGAKGIIRVSLYNPVAENAGKTFEVSTGIYFGDYYVEEGLFVFEIEAKPDSIVNVSFDFSSFAKQLSEADGRILSVVLNDINAE